MPSEWTLGRKGRCRWCRWWLNFQLEISEKLCGWSNNDIHETLIGTAHFVGSLEFYIFSLVLLTFSYFSGWLFRQSSGQGKWQWHRTHPCKFPWTSTRPGHRRCGNMPSLWEKIALEFGANFMLHLRGMQQWQVEAVIVRCFLACKKEHIII